MTAAIKVSGAEGILSVIPSILGFHPADSLVVVGLSGEHGRVGPVSRLDLANAGMREPVEQIAHTLRDHSDRAVVVFYGAARDENHVVDRLEAAGLPVVSVGYTGNEPQPLNAQVQATSALNGRAVLPDRGALAASIEPTGAPPAPYTALLLRRLTTPADRDELLGEAIVDADAWLPNLIAACQQTWDLVGMEAANLLAVTGIVAYRTGDGALANAALARAFRIEPGHRLAALMRAFIDGGVPPEHLDGIAADIRHGQ